jgi:hypothetical protein
VATWALQKVHDGPYQLAQEWVVLLGRVAFEEGGGSRGHAVRRCGEEVDERALPTEEDVAQVLTRVRDANVCFHPLDIMCVCRERLACNGACRGCCGCIMVAA